MARNCEKLSEKAQEIFNSIKGHFPDGPFERVNWEVVGRVFDNVWYDLRLRVDRKRLAAQQKNMIGEYVEQAAWDHRREHGSLEGFTYERFWPQTKNQAELLLLLNDLDFQIETGDLTD